MPMDNILYIDDEQTNLKVFEVCFYEEYNIFTALCTKEADAILGKHEIKVIITDQRMPHETGIDYIERIHLDFPDIPFIILSAYADFDVANQAIISGSVYRFLLKPWKEDELKMDINNAIEKYNLSKKNKMLLMKLEQQNTELKEIKVKLEEENSYLKEEIKLSKNFEEIISADKKFFNIFQQIEQVADSDAPVFISGETGTGKELVARAIHNLSNRRHASFISVNCAAIPETLFESELFGHEKGAFTGAVIQRKGKFELAHQGTLFLDEIGELPLSLQPKLLRTLQEGKIERIGGSNTIQLNFRIVTATNRNLEKEIENKNFRGDLYYRLNVFPIDIPPLRQRKNDIPLLLNYFIKKFNIKYKKKVKSIAKKDVNMLKNYSWPGNVRELENIVERAIIISTSEKLNLTYVFMGIKDAEEDTKDKMLCDVEKKHILKVLEETSWKVGGESGASKILGLNRTTLIAKMKKLNISKTN